MTPILIVLLTIVLIVLSIAMVFFILMQRASTDGGLGTAFGGGMAESAFGAQTGNMLTKITTYSTGLFFLLAFILYLLYMSQASEDQFGGSELPVFPEIEASAEGSATLSGPPAPVETQVSPAAVSEDVVEPQAGESEISTESVAEEALAPEAE